MDDRYIYFNIYALITPVGEFTVTRLSDRKKVSFSVLENRFNYTHKVLNENNDIIGTINSDTNYQIEISTQNLEIGVEYMISFSSGKWEFLDSDEHTDCYSTFINGWVVGIGAYDPNDQEKFDQSWEYSKQKGYLDKHIIIEPPKFDETKFISHTLDALETLNGYRFKILDKSEGGIIVFEVAWIEAKLFGKDEYETALSLWLC